jgi:hypothetical protein
MSEPGFASLGPSLLARKGGAKPAMRPQVAPLVAALDEGPQAVPEEQLEDLGWNDMGHDSDAESGADIVPLHADMVADPATASPGPIVRRQQRRLEQRLLADAVMTGPEDREPEYDEDAEQDYEAAAFHANEDYAEAGEDEDDDEADFGDDAIYSPLVPQVASAPAAAPVVAAPVTGRKPASKRVPAIQSGRRAAFTLRLDAERHLKLRLAATMQGVSAQALVTEALDRLLAEHDELDVIANHLKRH